MDGVWLVCCLPEIRTFNILYRVWPAAVRLSSSAGSFTFLYARWKLERVVYVEFLEQLAEGSLKSTVMGLQKKTTTTTRRNGMPYFYSTATAVERNLTSRWPRSMGCCCVMERCKVHAGCWLCEKTLWRQNNLSPLVFSAHTNSFHAKLGCAVWWCYWKEYKKQAARSSSWVV